MRVMSWWYLRRPVILMTVVAIGCYVALFRQVTTLKYLTFYGSVQKLEKDDDKAGKAVDKLVYEENAVRQLPNKAFSSLKHDDPELISYVRHHQLLPPSREEYRLQNPNNVHFSQYGESQFAENNFLRDMSGGFFVEVAALDGELFSNSLYFEKYCGWTGLLIEPNPINFARLRSRKRKAYSINCGLSLTNTSGITTFSNRGGGIGRPTTGHKKGLTIKVFPLYTMLLALEVYQVDFFSLDIEGDEMKVIRTFPWDKVKVRLLCVEVKHVPEGVKAVVTFLESQGFTFLGKLGINAWFGLRSLLQETVDVEEFLKKNNITQQREYYIRYKEK